MSTVCRGSRLKRQMQAAAAIGEAVGWAVHGCGQDACDFADKLAASGWMERFCEGFLPSGRFPGAMVAMEVLDREEIPEDESWKESPEEQGARALAIYAILRGENPAQVFREGILGECVDIFRSMPGIGLHLFNAAMNIRRAGKGGPQWQ